ncbi:glutathione transferase [Auricularia subglabra TFB-10046 SS5]|nr:glutathione transferase [Auricularia subglabra TFB-10046 SS5]
MVKVILHGAPESTATQRVALVCKELAIDYDLKVVPWNDIKTPEHLTHHPFGQLPVLEASGYAYAPDDEFFLYESRAISRYLTLKYGKGSALLPPTSDLKATALFEAAASIEQADFEPYASAIANHLGEQTDTKRLAELTAVFNTKLNGYERILSKSRYLAGDKLTLADLFHIPYGYVIDSVANLDLLKTRPNVARWFQDITSRPSWQSMKNGAY